MSHRMKVAGFVTAAMVTVAFTGAARADQVVQVPIDTLLNARAVTTLTGGRLVPWTVGIDGNGNSDGYMTAAASKFHNDPATLKTLPDDGRFAADTRHPDVLLHFSNDADATSMQTHFVRGAGTFSVVVPPATYSKMFLFFTSSEGASALKITLTYADTMEIVNVTVPDYYTNVAANDLVIFNLASDLPKWSQTSTVVEMNHHNLTGVEIHPMAAKTLTGIQVDKTAPSYLVFWGATGLATGVDAGVGGDGSIEDARSGGDAPGSGDGGVVDASGGAAGSGGASVSGSGGATGSSTAAGTGGATGSGGAVGTGNAGGGSVGSTSATTTGSSGAGAQGPTPSDAGCSCDLARGRSNRSVAWGTWLLLAAVSRRRLRKEASSRA